MARQMDVPKTAAYDIRKGITCSHLEGFGLSLVGGLAGHSLQQRSDNGLILTLSLGPSWNNPDLTELLLSHLKCSMCVTSKDMITLPMSF